LQKSVATFFLLWDTHYGSFDLICIAYAPECEPLKLARKTQWIAIFSTDLDLSIEQIIEYYGARWKIESGFKELKQDIGSNKSQSRNAHAVINHINFSMMAVTVTWIYGARLEKIPERRHKVRGRNSFAFSDLRHVIARTALIDNFDTLCCNNPKSLKKSFINTLLRMVA
jgi:transposase